MGHRLLPPVDLFSEGAIIHLLIPTNRELKRIPIVLLALSACGRLASDDNSVDGQYVGTLCTPLAGPTLDAAVLADPRYTYVLLCAPGNTCAYQPHGPPTENYDCVGSDGKAHRHCIKPCDVQGGCELCPGCYGPGCDAGGQ